MNEAVTYSLHSFKHVYPTVGRQLGLSDPQIDVMALWASKVSSGLPARYDSAVGVAELRYKAFIVENVKAGYELVGDACVPNAPVVPLDLGSTPVVLAPPMKTFKYSSLVRELQSKPVSDRRGLDLVEKRP